MKKYCVQLSTGLIFRTEQKYVYYKTGAIDYETRDSDQPADINGWINDTTPVKNFEWSANDVIASWEE